MAADIGLIGLAVMGRNLVLNMARNGFEVAVYNRTTSKMTDFIEGDAGDTSVTGYEELGDLVESLSSPRIVMMMVKAGVAVDAVLGDLVPMLDDGDIVIDGGNADYVDTERRCNELAAQGVLFVGAGVSGGEAGALNGPSIMPGGSRGAWEHVKPILQAIAATADDGKPCCEWVGPGGAGHFVKMVHNGIEYGDMQVIAEAYSIMQAQGCSNAEMGEAFAVWNRGKLESFLIEITAEILATTSPDGEAVIDVILDAAGQKGTGRWTAMYGFELGQPVSLIAEAVIARVVSALIDQRQDAAAKLTGPDRAIEADDVSLDDLRDALYASKIVSYAQGFAMLAAASREHDWDLDLGEIAAIWRAGCIIRAAFLDDITSVFADQPQIASLLLAETFADAMQAAQPGWRRTIGTGIAAGVPLPAFSSALAFYDGYRSERLPANLIQAQRDYFGAHTYERIDQPRGVHFHTNWIDDASEGLIDH